MKANKCAEYIISVIECEGDEELKKVNIHNALTACMKCFKTKPLEQILNIRELGKYLQQPLRNGDSFLHLAAKQYKKNYRIREQDKLITLLAEFGVPINFKWKLPITPCEKCKSP